MQLAVMSKWARISVQRNNYFRFILKLEVHIKMKIDQNLEYDSFIKTKTPLQLCAGFDAVNIGQDLFDFQAAIVKWACKRGRASIFADTGLGKTIMQVEWAHQVAAHTGGRVLILAPLCVAQQTVDEAAKFGITVQYCRKESQATSNIVITNYEMIDHFNTNNYVGVVLDESSILKSHDSKTRAHILSVFNKTPYRLSCTATPSPNDYMELGNQAEFLGIMSAVEMLAMFFTHDSSNTSKWRLKGHGKTKFWKWMSTWSVCVKNPSDLGFDGSQYILPGLNMQKHVVQVLDDIPLPGTFFASVAKTLTERRTAKRSSIQNRINIAANLANSHTRPCIVWCHLNDESKALTLAIPGSVEVTGSMSADEKEDAIMAFTRGDKRVIVTKPSIAGFGMNWQHCSDMIFAGIDDSFESFYQAIRRCFRFGQKKVVNVHLVSSSAEGAVVQNLMRKQEQALEMASNMMTYMRELTKQTINGAVMEISEYANEVVKGNGWSIHLGDCVEVINKLPDNSIDFSVFSPPFTSLYTYSNSDRDMGNCKSYGEFYEHFKFLVTSLFRVTKPGRLLSFHCMNLQTSKFRDGVIGLHDFRGEMIRLFVDAGWIYHSEVCIWKDPVTAMQRTKALGLLHKTIRKDSSMSRQGIPDYLVTMRKPGENADYISHTHEEFPVERWQRYASPVWMDIRQTRTLQFRSARESDDERHICPLQLDVIERAIELWSNPGDVVLSPFAGIGSEGVVALNLGRRFVGIELKRSYWELAKSNLESRQTGLFTESFDENSGPRRPRKTLI